jgi:RNA polymerase sigma-70 factor (ECF subfamily)
MSTSPKQQYQQFTNYYHEYKDKVYTYIFFRVGKHQQVAEDLTADIFVKAFKSMDSYDETYAFSTWIFTIAKRTLIDYYRKKKPVFVEELPEDAKMDNEFFDYLDTTFDFEQVKTAIAELSPAQRECVELRFLKEQTTKEIAEQKDMSEAAVRKNISRGLRALRQNVSLAALLLSVHCIQFFV